MLQTIHAPRPKPSRKLPPLVADLGLDEASPYGLQGLKRENLTLVKPQWLNRCAAQLALRGTPRQIEDREFVMSFLKRNSDWCEEYSVVRIIEKTLWIDGHSELVMTLLRNPSQIPDDPPREICQTLTEAYLRHPQATIWYGVPLFRDEVNADGLPIPMTADEVREESRRRIEAIQSHALKWGWFYRLSLQVTRAPGLLARMVAKQFQRVRAAGRFCSLYYQLARKDARRRTRAAIRAQQQYCRTGRSTTVVPEHSTLLGKSAQRTLESLLLAQSLAEYTVPIVGNAALPSAIATVIPFLIPPLTMVACDPFLFVELPDEPGKLRHLGHWYWQVQADGQRQLHLHV